MKKDWCSGITKKGEKVVKEYELDEVYSILFSKDIPNIPKNNIMKLTIDDIKRLHGKDKRDCLELYHEFIKEERKKERKATKGHWDKEHRRRYYQTHKKERAEYSKKYRTKKRREAKRRKRKKR